MFIKKLFVKNRAMKKQGLKFFHIGGAGNFYCRSCQYEERIVSFIHGDYDAVVGYQCQKCGKFHNIESHSKEYHMVHIVDPLVCECGGKLSRDEVLFCPKCKSKDTEYFMHYIT
jgi:hypothetical protein